MMTPQVEKNLMAKLRSPLHVSYIARIIKCEEKEAESLMLEWEEQGIVFEYNPEVAKKYYVLKNK